MPDGLLTREDFWALANDGIAIAGMLGALIAVVLGMAFVKQVWS